MLLTLEVLPAAEGDCLLLHWKTAGQPKIALIDGGPGQIYEEHLRPRLDDIVTNLEVKQLALELVMVSHMDSDHIVGVKKLIRAIRQEIDNNAPIADRTLKVRRLWLNVFNDILGDSIDKYYKALTASVQASIGGKPNPELVDAFVEKFKERQADDEEMAEFEARSVAAVLAGYPEGRDVRDDHNFLFKKNQTAALNNPFTDAQGRPTLITVEKTHEPAKIAGLSITIVGPRNSEIKALQTEFDDYIEEHGLTAEALLAAYADPSVKNLSSIACLVELDGKRIFLTGDARGDVIIRGLEAQNLFDEDGRFVIDILKVPHHGSDNNVKPEFFEKIIADTYVLSGDGKHGNPERNTIQWIVDARGKDTVFDLVLTYDIASIDERRKADFETKQKRKKKTPPLNWSHDEQSLQAFFEWTDGEGYTFTRQTGAPVMIDLGDETVGY
jgi:beta-lactamase superfamily II metal-dependent hydrolase